MEETTLDTGLIDPERLQITYAGFWPRLGALFVDFLVLAPFGIGISYFNITQWKSVPLLILVTVVSLGYKPFCEFNYGATLGKMALKLKVVNLQFGNATLQEILMRNIFHVVPSLVSLIPTVAVFTSPEFLEMTDFKGFMEYNTLLGADQRGTWINGVTGILLILDVIFLLSDKQKRSLHDRIGNTYVIQTV
jgi:uncharacterized RDD family membrane protein YckC